MLVAIAILGLGLTVILSSQAGLFASSTRGEHLTVASNLLRCKMSEVELDLMQKGFSLADENDEGECCDEGEDGYSCSWKVERVELPPLPESSGADGDAGTAAPEGVNGELGPLGALAQVQATEGASLGDNPTPTSIAEQLGAGTGSSGMEGMVMGLVYPSLKPMLEASIRRLTVKVMWKEGARERDLEVTQFVTRPQEGELATADQLGLVEGVGGTTATVPGTLPPGNNTAGSGFRGRFP